MKANNQKSYVYKLQTALFITSLLLVSFCILFYLYDDVPKKSFFLDVSLTVFSTLISILIIGILYQIFMDKENNKTLTNCILNSLFVEKSILKNYNPSGIKSIIKNCFSFFYGEHLSENYMNSVLENQLNNISYRKNLYYNVRISQGTNSNIDNNVLSQELNYTKYLRSDSRKITIECFFGFNTEVLNSRLNDKNIFFREVLANENFINEIRNTQSDNKILDALNFDLKIDGVKIDANKLVVSFILDDKNIRQGILISTEIPKSKYCKSDDGYFFYNATIECKYPDNKASFFYCIFAEPTINAKFEIKFEQTIIDVKDVNFVNLVDTNAYSILRKMNDNSIVFERKDRDVESMIFPRSSIVFHWNKK